MSQGLYSHTTRSVGTILTASIYNADHQNHITNLNPTMSGGYSDDVGQMQSVSDPGGVGTESLATNLAGELEHLRFVIARILGAAQWYETPTVDLANVVAPPFAASALADGVLGQTMRVRAATTAAVTIVTALNNGDVLDGVTLATGDRVLVKDQAAPAQNGIYEVAVSPIRVVDYDIYDEHPGAVIVVDEGTVNADTVWVCTSNKGGTLDTTAITFAKFASILHPFGGDSGSGGSKGAVPAPASGDAAAGKVLLASGSWGLTGPPHAYLEDRKAQNTHGGTFTSGDWRTRVLNTEVYDIAGIVTLASNRFTLQAGTYVVEWSAPYHVVNKNQTRLQNITDASTVAHGESDPGGVQSVYSAAGRNEGLARFTIAGAKAFEIQHECETTRATDGFGAASNLAGEVYTRVKIWKEG